MKTKRFFGNNSHILSRLLYFCLENALSRCLLRDKQGFSDSKYMRKLVFCLAFMMAALPGMPQMRRAVETSTDIVMFAPAVAGAVLSFVEADNEGLLQLVGSTAASVAAAYALKYTVEKERPDGSDCHSFPSNHTGFAFAGAMYIARRYGWEYALPVYLAGGYVAWGRVYARRHDIWDVLAGATIGAGCALLVTTPFAGRNKVAVVPVFAECGGVGVYASLSF